MAIPPYWFDEDDEVWNEEEFSRARWLQDEPLIGYPDETLPAHPQDADATG